MSIGIGEKLCIPDTTAIVEGILPKLIEEGRVRGKVPLAAQPAALSEPVLSSEQIKAAREAGVDPAIEIDVGGGVTMRMVLIPPGRS